MNLATNRKKQSKAFEELCLGKTEQKFCNYLSWRPGLYDGVDLDSATIEYINLYFYDYEVNPVEFYNHFRAALMRAVPTYNNLKAIELNKRVFDITTNKNVRKITNDTINDIQKDGTISKLRKDRGTVQDVGTGTDITTASGTETTRGDSSKASKQANRTLPMNIDSDNYDDLFSWDRGAGNISENRDETENSETSNNNSSGTSTTTSNTTKTYNLDITNDDTNSLIELGNIKVNSNDKYEEVGQQAVKLIKNIWDYLVEPKAIDYLVDELKNCFILII